MSNCKMANKYHYLVHDAPEPLGKKLVYYADENHNHRCKEEILGQANKLL